MTDQTDHRADPVREWGPEFGDVIAVVRSRALSIGDAWAVLAAARPAIEREAKAAALREAADAVWPIDGRTRDAKTMVDWLRATADRIEEET